MLLGCFRGALGGFFKCVFSAFWGTFRAFDCVGGFDLVGGWRVSPGGMSLELGAWLLRVLSSWAL